MKFLVNLLCASLVLTAAADDFDTTTATVGHVGNALVTPVNQLVTPAGTQIDLPGMRPNALALSPDGTLLLTSGLTRELLVLDPATTKILQHVDLPSDKASPENLLDAPILDPQDKAKLSFTGLVFSPDGSRIYLANVNGDIKVFGVAKNLHVSPLFSFPLPLANAPHRKEEIPAGIAVSRDGKKIYVALNLSNRLAEMDTATGKVLRIWDVGVAPFDVALVGHKAYVSNWGGRRTDAHSFTGPAGRGTFVRVDNRYIADEGSVTVIDLDAGPETAGWEQEILTGVRACALAVSPNGRYLVVANAGSDSLTVIDTREDKIIETICARQDPGDLFGAQPNALAFDKRGKTLYACNGSQNAVAVFQFNPGESKLLGLIPVGWFPGAICCDAHRNTLYVANIKSIAETKQKPGRGMGAGLGFNTHQYYGSLSFVPLPSGKELAAFTQKALANLRYPLLAQAKLPPREGVQARPVPERVGEPSVFKHVIYIIKENRSYDQVLGDVTNGNGDADLCIFGEHVTPNEHKLVREFTLLDNTYCSSILSADGHNWTDTGLATDYLERSFAGWPRSYPSGGDEESVDALAYSPAGFIWDDALAHGKTFRDYGEFTTGRSHWTDLTRKKPFRFLDSYRDSMSGSNAITYICEPEVETLRPYIREDYPSWNLDVPDQLRAAKFIEDLKKHDEAGTFPDFTIVWMPNDHTSGTKPGSPKPEAQVADNDLAVGKIVAAVSHSAFWKDTCIFCIEDDPQNGWDHVSGYRTTAYVISPYTKRHAVVSTQYNQTSLLRTMELILGLPPMNQFDATATPMFDCFTDAPDFAPFDSVANNVQLDDMNPPARKVSDAQLRKDAYVSARLPLTLADQCPEGVLNEILWRSVKGMQSPYPSWAVKVVDDD
ncbi:MAG TPA: bifunctional YncE family protein/alkaline phosphatase family protein [Verrucomicrobiae bacterium]|nr:bifunctional YncE family protein/alkaline phosphatase family protein [Verrucomicrobiae bacterium]